MERQGPEWVASEFEARLVTPYVPMMGGQALRKSFERFRGWLITNCNRPDWWTDGEVVIQGGRQLDDLQLHHFAVATGKSPWAIEKKMSLISNNKLERAAASLGEEKNKPGRYNRSGNGKGAFGKNWRGGFGQGNNGAGQ